MNKTRISEIVAFALLAVVAVWGWTRKSDVANAASTPYVGTQMQAAAPGATPISYDASNPCVAPGQNTEDTNSQRYYSPDRPAARLASQPVYQSSQPVYYSDRPVHPRGRSTKKSVALVAGSAGAGAAIGALAGGGRGAGIGALAGGAAGLIYDRFTHKTHSGL